MLNLQAGGDERPPAMLGTQRPLRQDRGRAVAVGAPEVALGALVVDDPQLFPAILVDAEGELTSLGLVEDAASADGLALEGDESQRRLTAVRGFGSGRRPDPEQTRRQRDDHPRCAGQVDPTAEQPADRCRPGRRISDDAVGAIDLGHEPSFEPLPECVGTAVGRLLLAQSSQSVKCSRRSRSRA